MDRKAKYTKSFVYYRNKQKNSGHRNRFRETKNKNKKQLRNPLTEIIRENRCFKSQGKSSTLKMFPYFFDHLMFEDNANEIKKTVLLFPSGRHNGKIILHQKKKKKI